jgi:hypothetical protein
VPRSASELAVLIAAAESRQSSIAGVSATSIGDQRTDFDGDGLAKYIASLRAELAIVTASSGTRTRYAGFDKGLR